MGRFSESSNDDELEGGIDMSPLIDCVFILLIFFIVTTVFVEESGIEVDKPNAASASQLEKTSVLIAISAAGEVVYGGSEIGVGGVQSTVKREISKEMIPVIIQADKDAKYGLVARVLDEAKLAGAEKVSFATTVAGS
ncbi:biopolymer transport protein ExbD [Planctomycetes bacterium Pla163]|uniref:Biopolymer transport protein ExbD n=1 Tax=Rohdeia mirabilis TaxID=2528008 RepID=A0A518CXI2_9BACT|nr:biopolymer transport protein ExbD [Planctomycetes bacterium Pla163]